MVANAAPSDLTSAFTDAAFLAEIRRALSKQPTDAITAEECAAIKSLRIPGRGIASVAGIENLTELESLFLTNNPITVLDLSHNLKLKKLVCYNNELTSLNVASNAALTHLECDENQLETLDVSHTLDCVVTRLTSRLRYAIL
jgi:Leucine-rich repeat (LRR) protein